MLKIYVGSLPNEIRSASVYFDINYKPEWLDDELNKKMIEDVDKSNVISRNIIESSVLGTIPPQWLSGGVKALICMNSDKKGYIFNLSNCGDNCAKWVRKISENKDLLVTTHHYMSFRDAGDFKIEMVNTGKIVNTNEEYLDEFIKIKTDIINKLNNKGK